MITADFFLNAGAGGMNLFVSTFGAVAVLLGIGIVGFIIIKRRVLPQQAFDMLSPLGIDIALRQSRA